MKNTSHRQLTALQDRFGLKAASCLSEGTADLPRDISERLRAARAQAVARRKLPQTRTAGGVVAMGASAALTWGAKEGLNWWSRIGAALPLLALVGGLLVINSLQTDNRIQELAEVDSALLTDVLPPAAFSDPGFVQFLKATGQAAASE